MKEGDAKPSGLISVIIQDMSAGLPFQSQGFAFFVYLWLKEIDGGQQMKISSIECGRAYNQTTEVNTKILPAQRPFTSTKIKSSDKAFISPLAQGMAVAEEALKSVPDVREDIVASIKEKIQSGTYKVSGEEIADMMIRRLSADRIR